MPFTVSCKSRGFQTSANICLSDGSNSISETAPKRYWPILVYVSHRTYVVQTHRSKHQVEANQSPPYGAAKHHPVQQMTPCQTFMTSRKIKSASNITTKSLRILLTYVFHHLFSLVIIIFLFNFLCQEFIFSADVFPLIELQQIRFAQEAILQVFGKILLVKLNR